MIDSERSSFKHSQGWVKTPSQILYLHREVGIEVVNSFSSGKGVAAVLIGVSAHISHSKTISRYNGEVDKSKDDDLTISR